MANTQKEYTNLSLDKALRLLRMFDKNTPEMAISELGKRMRVNPSSLYPILGTLQKYDYVRQNADGKYSLGFAFLEMGNHVLTAVPVMDFARGYLLSLATHFRGNAHLAAFYRWHALVLDRKSYSDRIWIRNVVGHTTPLHCSSLGKSLLAFRDPAAVEEFVRNNRLERFTDRTIVDPDELLAEIGRIRERGYSRANGEYNPRHFSIAAPVLDQSGEAAAAINVAVESPDDIDENEAVNAIIEAADQISAMLRNNNPRLY